MKSLISLSLVAWLAAGMLAKTVQGAAAEPSDANTVAQWHCLGSARLFQLPGTAKLKSISEMAETKRLLDHAVNAFARAPKRWINRDVSNDELAALQPLLIDLLQAETVGDIRISPSSPNDFQYVLGMKLDQNRSAQWDRALRYLMASWKMGAIELREQEGFRGWEIPKEHDNFYLMRSDQWVFIGWGYKGLPSQTRIWKSLSEHSFPENQDGKVWLDAKLDCARLTRSATLSAKSGWCALPRIELLLANTNENVRTFAKLTYPEDQKWQLDPWRIPVNTISEPLISFTALRGIASDLAKCTSLKAFDLNSMPDQIYIWAQGEIPFQTFVAAPIQGVTNLINRLAAQLPALVFSNWLDRPLGTIQFNKNNTEVAWNGLAVVVPSLRPSIEPVGEFLLAGVFPPSLNTNPPPSALMSEITSHKDLLYYDWEITEERLKQIRILSQLWDIIFSDPTAPPPMSTSPTSLSQEWLLAVGKHLGNSVTQVSVTSPRELSLVRRSHFGLTGMELVFLGRWLDDPQFPFSSILDNWKPRKPQTAAIPK